MPDTRTDTWIDRTGWSSGPWDDEPDRVEWRDEGTGLPCLALRHHQFGNWCGYVAVPPGHPWHGVESDARVHGGLTFYGPCMDDDRPKREQVCHVPEPGEPDDVWWLGFDLGHGEDLQPGMLAMEQTLAELIDLGPLHLGEVYRTLDYVREQCELLAYQAARAS